MLIRKLIINKLLINYPINTKNDKVFAVNSKVTHFYMQFSSLTQPRIKKSEIQNIILEGRENLLTPERRFDAIIHNSPDLFCNSY